MKGTSKAHFCGGSADVRQMQHVVEVGARTSDRSVTFAVPQADWLPGIGVSTGSHPCSSEEAMERNRRRGWGTTVHVVPPDVGSVSDPEAATREAWAHVAEGIDRALSV